MVPTTSLIEYFFFTLYLLLFLLGTDINNIFETNVLTAWLKQVSKRNETGPLLA